mmetsp:Transcript_8690/g.26730  ORF Transcript_8690/g.26730 Transcript_8690/m.26730 type:complete len:90 (-) Transcript_8690:768-1037(-)|eukprot:scaffold251712_cov33-Tisochrysis_lutea.AAC.1
MPPRTDGGSAPWGCDKLYFAGVAKHSPASLDLQTLDGAAWAETLGPTPSEKKSAVMQAWESAGIALTSTAGAVAAFGAGLSTAPSSLIP